MPPWTRPDKSEREPVITKDAHINAEKTKEAWFNSRTWRLDTPSSGTEEKNWFLRFSHNWIAEDLLATFMSGEKTETVCFITVIIWRFGNYIEKTAAVSQVRQNTTDFAHRAKIVVGKSSASSLHNKLRLLRYFFICIILLKQKMII